MLYGFQGNAKMCITAKMAISMQRSMLGMPIRMSGYAIFLVGWSGPFADEIKEMTICIDLLARYCAFG